MKLNSCVKTPGGGVSLPSKPLSQSVVKAEPATLQPATIKSASPKAPTTSAQVTLTPCRHIDRLNRRCRLFSTIPNLELCPHHTRLLEKQHQRHNDNTAAELLGDLTDFSTPDAINALLGNLVRQLARKRIARLDAIAIAYVAQLLLGSIASMDRHDAALRTAEDANADDFPTRIVFDRPAELDPTTIAFAYPTSDSLRIAASFGARPTSDPQ